MSSQTSQSDQERLAALEVSVAALTTRVDGDFVEIKRDVRELRDTLAGRPTWSVCMIIAGLGATTTGLGATLLTILVNNA